MSNNTGKNKDKKKLKINSKREVERGGRLCRSEFNALPKRIDIAEVAYWRPYLFSCKYGTLLFDGEKLLGPPIACSINLLGWT